MSFASIAIKTSIPATAPAATSGALTFITIEDENWLQITGDASAGSGSLYVLRWNADLAEWRPYMEDKPIAVDSAVLNGLFSAYYPFPKGEESFCLYDPAAAITATASAARTGSPLVAPTPASSGAAGGATEAKQDAGNASLVSIDAKLTAPLSVTATPGNTVNAANSSTTPLAGGATFTGTGVDILAYAGVEVFAYADVAGTLYLEYSTNNSNWDLSLAFPLAAGSAVHVPAGADARYFRARYVNGGAAQATFRLQTLLLGTAPAPHAVAIGSAPISGNAALLTQSELIGLSSAGGGTYVPVKVAPSGAVQVGGEVSVSDGTNTAAILNTAPTTQYGLVTRNIPSGTQAISAASLPLPTGAATSALQGGGLPAALVGGRLDINTGAWLGSTAPTVGQKTMSASVPVAIASDQSTLPVVQPSATYSVISTSTTTTVAASARTLYKIFWAAGVSSTLAAYDDGAGGTTNQFVSKLTSADGEIDFGPLGVQLVNGLTVVTTGGTPAFITIILRT